MRFLFLAAVLELHRQVIEQSGGAGGLFHLSALESALAQPHMTFAGEELYPALVEKAAASGVSVIKNHPFVDGNNRPGHAAMETLLVLNGYEIRASGDEQEHVILPVATGAMAQQEFTIWLRAHVVQR